LAKPFDPEQFATGLNDAYQRTSSYLIMQAGTQAKANFIGLPDWRDDNIDEFLDSIVRDIGPVKQTAAQYSIGYHSQIARLYQQKFDKPGYDPEEFTTEKLRNGADFRKVFTRPFIEMRTALAQGRSVRDAVYLGGQRASSLAQVEVQLARRKASLVARTKNDNIVGYLRVLSGAENCALCYVASTQRYRRGDLLPIHPGCDCGEMPIYGDTDPGQVVDEYNLEKAHQAVEERFGESARDARTLPYRDIIIHEHGELGPVLGIRGQKFTGPNDLSLVGSKVRKLDPSPVPLRDLSNPYWDDPLAVEYSQDAVAEGDRILLKSATFERPITEEMTKLANSQGSELRGLDFRLKARESLARKIQTDAINDNVTIEVAASKIGDSIRYTMVADPKDYAATIRNVVSDLERDGYQVIKQKNYWQAGNGYKGFNTSILDPNGFKFELQFHTPKSYDVKDPSHELYEESRKQGVDEAKRDKLVKESRALWDKVETPVGLDDLGTASFQ
jgi:hypothetical protein